MKVVIKFVWYVFATLLNIHKKIAKLIQNSFVKFLNKKKSKTIIINTVVFVYIDNIKKLVVNYL